MHIKTVDLQDTEQFMKLVDATQTVRKVQKILANKHSHSDQIAAIKKVLTEATQERKEALDE